MKAISLIVLVILLSGGCTLNQKTENENSVRVEDLKHPWFNVEKINESTWKISDHGEDNIYLVEGSDSSLLIDTGLGAVNLADFIKKITRRPLIIVNTHGHPDHVGSNNQFESVYAHPGDMDAIRHFTNRQVQKQLLQYMVQIPIPDSVKFSTTDTTKVAALVPLSDGRIIDLGDRQLEIIHVAGHTPGSICILDSKSKLLFTGDHLKDLVWLHMEESLPVEEYLANLIKLKKRESEFDNMMGGHNAMMKKQFLSDVISCAESILAKNCQSTPYESVVGNGLLCNCGSAKVAYNPRKLKSGHR